MINSSAGKRIGAFIIDMIIINVIFSIITIGFPNSRKYVEVKKDSERIINEYFDNKIEAQEAFDKAFENQYVLEKEAIPHSLISLTITVGYFVLFAYYNKGQTIGKKLVHIRVVSEDGSDVNYGQLFGRALIINECLLSIVSLILIGFIKSNQYFYTIGLLGFIQSIVVLISIIMVLRREDKRGLHDIIFKTKVIEC